jgi:metallo-beta-lactamase family protein
MHITFYGAAREVTGSCNLLNVAGLNILVDCGMFQGGPEHESKNFDPLPFNPADISAVVVTHAHLDHVGRLPLLIRGGFTGYFYATPATIELAELILEDTLHIMTYNNEKLGMPILYDQTDIAAVMMQFKALDYHESLILPGRKGKIKIEFYDAGHIFGSVFAVIDAEGKRVVFSGDIGNVNVPILRETEGLPGGIDVLVCESTYGDRLHETNEKRQEVIERMVSAAVLHGGVLMVPSFSLERTQELIYDLNDLIDRKRSLPRVPIFLDSPLAIGATKVYRKYINYYDEAAKRLVDNGDDLFEFPGLTMCETKEESKRINQVPAPKIIIAGAGMMTGGRIVHHAKRYLSDDKNTLLIIGYQASGTLGRRILEGESPVMIYGERIPVRCHIDAIGALSAHGDQKKLLDWIGGGNMLPKKVCLNHGEPLASEGLAERLNEDLGLKASVVSLGMSVEV